MERTVLQVVDGPDKPALQWAVSYPDREQVHFKLAGDAIDARIERIDEQGPSFDFKLTGMITSGVYKNRRFEAVYSVESRSGTITLQA